MAKLASAAPHACRLNCWAWFSKEFWAPREETGPGHQALPFTSNNTTWQCRYAGIIQARCRIIMIWAFPLLTVRLVTWAMWRIGSWGCSPKGFRRRRAGSHRHLGNAARRHFQSLFLMFLSLVRHCIHLEFQNLETSWSCGGPQLHGRICGFVAYLPVINKTALRRTMMAPRCREITRTFYFLEVDYSQKDLMPTYGLPQTPSLSLPPYRPHKSNTATLNQHHSTLERCRTAWTAMVPYHHRSRRRKASSSHRPQASWPARRRESPCKIERGY